MYKIYCYEIIKKISEFFDKMKNYYEFIVFILGMVIVYYWGNIFVVDFINFFLNEGCEYFKLFLVFVCGVGDL